MGSGALSRHVEKVVCYPPLSELSRERLQPRLRAAAEVVAELFLHLR
jgi:hypothetical protein